MTLNNIKTGGVFMIQLLKSKKKYLLILFLFSILLSKGYAIQLGNMEVNPKITLKSEYNDNVNLGDGTEKEIKDDLLFYVNPTVVFKLPYMKHVVSLDFGADYRKGTKTNLSELNAKINGKIALRFTGGLDLTLIDNYSKRNFDQELQEEEITSSDRESNTYGVSSSYIFGKLIKVEAGYKHTWDEYKYETSFSVNNSDMGEWKISMPIRYYTEIYSSGSYKTQESKEKPEGNFNDLQYLLGVKWKGPNRFSFWLNAGQENIDYELAAEEDYNNITGEGGIDIKFTEKLKGSFALGRNGYGNTVYNGNICFQCSEERKAKFSFYRKTQSEFTTSTIRNYTNFKLQLTKKIMYKVTVKISGSYLLTEPVTESETAKDYQTWIGAVDIFYPIQDWLKTGFHYQYSSRKSDITTYEFENNRVGLFVTMSF